MRTSSRSGRHLPGLIRRIDRGVERLAVGRPRSRRRAPGSPLDHARGCFATIFAAPERPANDTPAGHVSHGGLRTIDLGRVRYTGPDGQPAERRFANVASAGMTGVAADIANRSAKTDGATVAYAQAVSCDPAMPATCRVQFTGLRPGTWTHRIAVLDGASAGQVQGRSGLLLDQSAGPQAVTWPLYTSLRRSTCHR